MEEEKLHEACGVFGALAMEPTVQVADIIYHGLIGLQHRGQESAGMIIHNGHTMKENKGMGLVGSIFTEQAMKQLSDGKLGIGHTRYSTQGDSSLANCQPIAIQTSYGRIALAHNGQLVNQEKLRKVVLAGGIELSTSSDSEIIAQLLAASSSHINNNNNNGNHLQNEIEASPHNNMNGNHLQNEIEASPHNTMNGNHLQNDIENDVSWATRIRHFMQQCPMSYSLVIMTSKRIYGVRDPYGTRPLCIGRLFRDDDNKALGWVLSSESSPFRAINAELWREVEPGEIVSIDENGIRSVDIISRSSKRDRSAFCLFEYIYFAKSDTVLEQQMVYSVRLRCGQLLAIQSPVCNADLIGAVPESATPAAIGYSIQSGIPYIEVLTRNSYVGRTFIQPTNRVRQAGIRRKFGILSDNIHGKRLILIDDSIVRGNTMAILIKLLKSSGAKEVHIRIASPPIRHPCYMGIDIPFRDDLIANKVDDLTQLAERFNADSVDYLSYHGLLQAVQQGTQYKNIRNKNGYCSACFTGNYPVDIDW